MGLKANTLLVHSNNDREWNTGVQNFKLGIIIVAQSKTKNTDTFEAL